MSETTVATGTIASETMSTAASAATGATASAATGATASTAASTAAGATTSTAASTAASTPPRETLRYSYFPGCSADSTGISFTLSASYVADQIGLELVEIPDWCCCGTSAAQVTDNDLAIALSARSMALSEQAYPGLDVVAPCAGCYNALKRAVYFTRLNEGNHAHVLDLIEMPYDASVDVYSLLELLARPELTERIAGRITASLQGLKVASYYGCALIRPTAICQFDDAENPQSMDRLMELAGAEPVRWAFKTECCGASHQITTPKAGRELIAKIFANAAAQGAEAIVTACPLCMLNLDLREKEINALRVQQGEQPFDIPVYYFTELLGLVMGGSKRQLGIDRHFWPATGVQSTATIDTHPSATEADAAAHTAAPSPQAPDSREVAA